LEREGLKTAALHGDKSQDERLKALESFKSGEVDLLVCTDVAARGLDIKDVPAVFNFDLPFNAEDYVHRIGRTGRAGASGLAVSFVGGKNDARLVADIEKLIKVKIELEAVEFAENLPDIRAQGRINDGRRMYSEGTQDDSRRAPRSHGGIRDVAHEGQFARPARDERAPRRDYTRPPAAPRRAFPAAGPCGQHFSAPPPGERRLFLLIEGPTEVAVKRARAELRRTLEEETIRVGAHATIAQYAGKYTV
jgi:superfamily II DNA/RNA helicase